MDQGIRQLALRALRFLLCGTTIDAVRFRGNGFTLLFAPRRVDAGEVYLHLDDAWGIASTMSVLEPSRSLERDSFRPPEQLLQLYTLHEKMITDVHLGTAAPHLQIHFDDTTVLIVNGYHPTFESWEVGTALNDADADFCIVALPESRLAVWAPEAFHPQGREPEEKDDHEYG